MLCTIDLRFLPSIWYRLIIDFMIVNYPLRNREDFLRASSAGTSSAPGEVEKRVSAGEEAELRQNPLAGDGHVPATVQSR